METTSNVSNEASNEVNNAATEVAVTPTFDELHEQSTAQPVAEDNNEVQAGGSPENNGTETAPDSGTDPENLAEMQETPPIAIITEPELTPDEKIIDAWLKNGKTEVTTNELVQAGFDQSELDPQVNIIGRFKVSRMLLVNPYKIEKITN